ncbi:tyrosine-type recombinase/integrase [Kribbella italica]|uniref:Integrase n=1 Tax=Kribbella italica TaxID=1540520 RepID=A0A7W9JE15_9ACTN|nr:site-specific integrase [Kribbella italica]MBB5839713.1 integrase [Kribbella italica]
MGRKPNHASSIYKGSDGGWHGRVTVGVKDDGTPDRRHVRGKSEAVVTKKVRELERSREDGNVRKAGKPWTVEMWLNHWLENIARPSVRESSYAAYEVAVRKHLIPGIGAHRLDKLEPEHLEKLYRKMQEEGSKAGTAHQAHRTIRTALGVAHRRKRITKNPAAMAKPPRIDDVDDEVEPYTVAEVQLILEEAKKSRNSTRWAFALALGLRQGEALGLMWSDVDLDKGVLRVRRSRVRPKYEHGCGDQCGRKHAGYCPDRRQVGPEVANTKSKAGRRSMGLPDKLVELLRAHKKQQDAERSAARQLWQEGGWVFASETGEPLNPNTDYHRWKELLTAAEVREGRLHDARHTAATVLLVLGVPERAVMGIMGWSTTAMAARYQHITEAVRRDIADRVGGLLWAVPDLPATPEDRDEEGGAAGVAVPA